MTQVKYLFDNGSTVFFAIFMSLWAAFFLEGWKRYSAEICHHWDVYGFDPEVSGRSMSKELSHLKYYRMSIRGQCI